MAHGVTARSCGAVYEQGRRTAFLQTSRAPTCTWKKNPTRPADFPRPCGSALVEAIIGAREHHAARYGLRLEACLVADSSGVLCAAEGLSDDSAIGHGGRGECSQLLHCIQVTRVVGTATAALAVWLSNFGCTCVFKSVLDNLYCGSVFNECLLI